MSFSYFDLKTETYKRVSSKEIIIDVLEGPTNNSASDNSITTAANNKQKVVLSNDQFAFVKTETNLTMQNTKWLASICVGVPNE